MINEEKLNVKIFKLTNGENVIAVVLQETAMFFVVVNPINVEIDYDQSNEEDDSFNSDMHFSVNKWIPFVEEGTPIPLSRFHIVGYADINDSFKQFYIDAILGREIEINKIPQPIKPITELEFESLILDNFDTKNKIAN